MERKREIQGSKKDNIKVAEDIWKIKQSARLVDIIISEK